MAILSKLRGLIRSEHSQKIHNWSYVFIDALHQVKRESGIDVRLFVKYEAYNFNGISHVSSNFSFASENGFDHSIDVFFFIENDIKTIEIRDSLTPQSQHEIFLHYRLYPLISLPTAVYWMFMIPNRFIQGSEIVRSINSIFSEISKTPPEISTPLGKANLRHIPRETR